jgi:methyl-accepting chemotaxis protein
VNTGSLTRRTVIATLGVLVLALGGFAALITLRYRDGLQARARSQLLAGARAVTNVPQAQLKPLFASLALEGIDVQLGGGPPTEVKGETTQDGPVKPGTLSSGAHLLTFTEQISVDGKPATATLSTSEASIDSAVNSLIVIELVGAAAVLVAATVLTLLASRSALRPLRHVAAVAQGIAAGDRRQRLQPRRPQTELGQMADGSG